jgi:mRNA interferase HicA
MNRKEFIQRLIQDGCILLRSGARHDIYQNPQTGQKQPFPRHKEIDNALAKTYQKIPWSKMI